MGLDTLNAAVRPIVTLMVVSTLCFAAVVGILRGDIQLDVAAFIGIVGMVVTFWFSQRQAVKDSMPNGNAPVSPPTGAPKP